jgi:transposase
MKTLSRHSELAKAFTYTLNQWPALTYYAENGWAEADNNIAENALRMVSLGRKNWLFFGSDHGGERGALLYSPDRDVQTERRGSRKLPSPCP